MNGTEIAGLFVHPNAQRQGIGTALLQDRGARTVEVFAANTMARAFYHALGFRRTHTRLHETAGHRLCCLALDDTP